MRCDDVFEAILAGGELSEGMSAHAEQCDECRALQESVRLLDAEGEHDRQRDISETAVRRTIAAAHAFQGGMNLPPHAQMKEWWLFRGLAAAAAVIILAGTGVVMVQRLMRSNPVKDGPSMAELDSADFGMDGLRKDVRREVACFSRKHVEAASMSGIDADRLALRMRLEVAVAGIEGEIASVR